MMAEQRTHVRRHFGLRNLEPQKIWRDCTCPLPEGYLELAKQL